MKVVITDYASYIFFNEHEFKVVPNLGINLFKSNKSEELDNKWERIEEKKKLYYTKKHYFILKWWIVYSYLLKLVFHRRQQQVSQHKTSSTSVRSMYSKDSKNVQHSLRFGFVQGWKSISLCTD